MNRKLVISKSLERKCRASAMCCATTRKGERVARSMERLTFNQEVMGSNPIALTNKINCLDRYHDIEDELRGFIGQLFGQHSADFVAGRPRQPVRPRPYPARSLRAHSTVAQAPNAIANAQRHAALSLRQVRRAIVLSATIGKSGARHPRPPASPEQPIPQRLGPARRV